ncbi:MAG: glycerol-3-phosphate 1-O-acyltransferase PlsY [Gammaproteobacteria bacterium]|nr:MAG: glycerol-3-phosphate 1-O-acyltransferase PlsY [Gammaproteobacteria bacterium]
MTTFILKIVLAYLLGSVSGSLLLGKLKKVDIRRQGSGNAGGTNAFRTQGLLFGLGVVIIDIGKGFLAAWWIPTLDFGGSPAALDAGLLVMASGFAAVLGHCYPIWHGFRGGKGAATAIGAVIVIEPLLLLPVAFTWLAILLLTGYVGLATVLAGFSLVPTAWFLGNRALLVFSVVLALFLLFTHRNNIRNLRKGTEYRFRRMHLFSRKR